MNRYIDFKQLSGLPYSKVECSFLPLANCREDFIRSAAEYFVRQWMASALSEMMDVWNNWSTASDEQKSNYKLYIDAALLSDDPGNPGERILIDDPSYRVGRTQPIGAFTETMMRWFCETTNGQQLLIEPAAPQPAISGQIDFIEVNGIANDYASMSVKMWESKGTDGQAYTFNNRIYGQLDDYYRRLFYIANNLCESYSGNDLKLKLFLSKMATLAKNRDAKVHYGVFVAYDSNVPQSKQVADQLHQHPASHPSGGGNCHHLAILLIPDYKKLRLEVWKSLHLK